MSGKYDHKSIIITAPSGAGKTSITHHLLKTFPELQFSVSAATRKSRSNEKDGDDYYFMEIEEFQQKIKKKEFVEWEMVYEGKYYGTLKMELERLWALDKIPVLDIDVQGAIHVQERYPDTTMSIFIQPPSIEELQNRLLSRGSETADTLEARISKASYELTFANHFKNVIVNRDFVQACLEADRIVKEFINY